MFRETVYSVKMPTSNKSPDLKAFASVAFSLVYTFKHAEIAKNIFCQFMQHNQQFQCFSQKLFQIFHGLPKLCLKEVKNPPKMFSATATAPSTIRMGGQTKFLECSGLAPVNES